MTSSRRPGAGLKRKAGILPKTPAAVIGLALVLGLSPQLPARAAGFGHGHWHDGVQRFHPGRAHMWGGFHPGGLRMGPGGFHAMGPGGPGREGSGWERGRGRGEDWGSRAGHQDARDGRFRAWHGPNAGWRNPGFRNGGARNGQSGAIRDGMFRRRFFMPAAEEHRFVSNEVVLEMPSNVSDEQLHALAERHHMTRVGAAGLGTAGRTLYRWRVDDGKPLADVIRNLQAEGDISAAQPNFTFTLQDQATHAELREGDPAQYAVAKLHLPEAHHLATGHQVMVAVIDSAIDPSQPELRGAIAGTFDAVGGVAAPDSHGTAMAGAIAAHGRLMGVAPQVSLLAVRAFASTANGEQATTFNVVRAIDWAVSHGARVINMSFAGPKDPVLQEALARARDKGVILVAAAGNAGPQSPPLYPAADPGVIAVTATDAKDSLFAKANRGGYVALAAPGVDVLVPAPHGGVQLTSGTSVAAAEVTGIVALMLERNRSLGPDQARMAMTTTARQLGAMPRNDDFGAGLVNAWQAVRAAALQAADQAKAGSPPRP